MIQIPVGLFGVATGFAALPVLSQAALAGSATQFSQLLWSALSSTLWMALWTVLFLGLFAAPLCVTLFSHGRFTLYDGLHTGAVVSAYATGVFFASGSRIFTQAFYACGKTFQIVVNACVFLGLTALFSAYFTKHFGILGLGFSNTLANGFDFAINFFFLKYVLKKKKLWVLSTSHYLALIGSLVCVMGAGAVGFWVHKHLWLAKKSLTVWQSLAVCCGAGVVFLGLFLIITIQLGPQSLREMCIKGLRKVRIL